MPITARTSARRAVACAVSALAATATLLAQNPRTRHNVGTERFTKRVLASGLGNPWEVTWGPDGFLWVTERSAFRVTRIDPSAGSAHVALTVDDAYSSVDQDGLLGMALHPDLLRGRGHDFVYLAYVYNADTAPSITRRMRVRRWTYDARTQGLGSPTTVIDNLPAWNDHGGGRLVFGPDGKLYLSRGDQGSNFLANYCNQNHAQDLPTAEQVRARDWSTYQGKILRINLDGSIPADNPLLNGARSHIFTYGHRNPQGLVFGAGGTLYEAEHGPSSDDELNIIQPGRNYGWPYVAGFNDDRGYVYANWSASTPTPCSELRFSTTIIPDSVPQQKESAWHGADFMPPIATFFTVPPDYDFATLGTATIAPSGIDLYTSSTIPGWRSSVLIASLRAGAIYRVKLSADGRSVAGEPVEYFKETTRFRDIAISPDGRRIFASTDDHGTTQDDAGRATRVLTDPGSILEFTYSAK
jgi:PQQ-dependent dehydrogenase (s-GDH family)